MNKILLVLSAILLTADVAFTANLSPAEKEFKKLSEEEIHRIIPNIKIAKQFFAPMLAPNAEHLLVLATDTLNQATSKLNVIPVAGNSAVKQFAPFDDVKDAKLKKTFMTLNLALSTYLDKLQSALAKIIPDANKAKDVAVNAIIETGRNTSATIVEEAIAGYVVPHWLKIANSPDQKIFNCDIQLSKTQFEELIKIEKSNLACADVIIEKNKQMGIVVTKVVDIGLVDLKLVTEAIPSCMKSVGVTNVAQIDALPVDKISTLDTCLKSIETAKPLSISVGSETLINLFDDSISASRACITNAIKFLIPIKVPLIKAFVDCLEK